MKGKLFVEHFFFMLWQKYVSSINSRTPSKKIWNMISKITGKNIPSHVLHLKDKSTGDLITNKNDIAAKIGSSFQKKTLLLLTIVMILKTSRRKKKKINLISILVKNCLIIVNLN